MKMNTTLQGKNIFLRPLRITDAPRMTELLQEKSLYQWTLTLTWPYHRKDAQAFIERTQQEKRLKKRYAFAIIEKKTKTFLGIVDLFNISIKEKHAELGYWLGKPYQNKGIMTEAVHSALTFAFQSLHLHRVSATLFKPNIASRRVLEKNGFQLEGVIREERKRYGKWHDVLCYGILKHEWKQGKRKNTNKKIAKKEKIIEGIADNHDIIHNKRNRKIS